MPFQIIHCKANISIPNPPPCERRIWNYPIANVAAIQRSLLDFPWEQQFDIDNDIDKQVETFNQTVLNVMDNFIPNKMKKFNPRVPPWLTKQLKSKLYKKIDSTKTTKIHGYKDEDRVRLEAFREDCSNDVERAKQDYLKTLVDKQKVYWKIVPRINANHR